MNTGQEFVKKIGPFGSVLFMALFIAFLVYAFTFSPKDSLEGYSPPHDFTYYSGSEERMSELKTELEENVFPLLKGVISTELKDGKLVISIAGKDFVESRDSILGHYDEDLFYFQRR